MGKITDRSHWKTVLPLLFLSLFSTVGSSWSSSNHRQASSTIRFRLGRDSGAERLVPMRAGAAFKIALFADLHFGEAESTVWGPVQDVNSIKVMNTVLDDETPDGVVKGGEEIAGDFNHGLIERVKQLEELLLEKVEENLIVKSHGYFGLFIGLIIGALVVVVAFGMFVAI